MYRLRLGLDSESSPELCYSPTLYLNLWCSRFLASTYRLFRFLVDIGLSFVLSLLLTPSSDLRRCDLDIDTRNDMDCRRYPFAKCYHYLALLVHYSHVHSSSFTEFLSTLFTLSSSHYCHCIIRIAVLYIQLPARTLTSNVLPPFSVL